MGVIIIFQAIPAITTILATIYVMVYTADKWIAHGRLSAWGCGKSFDHLPKEEWYRVVTGPFFHLNAIHLVANTLAIYFVGAILENVIGSLIFFGIYMLGNLGTSIIFAYFRSFTYGRGASPGIYALLGCVMIGYLQHHEDLRLAFDTWQESYIGYYFILGNFIGMDGFLSHVAGLGIGIMLSLGVFVFIG